MIKLVPDLLTHKDKAMRGIPASGVYLFIIVIALIEISAYLGIIQLIDGKKQRRLVGIIYWFITIMFQSVWFTAFFNPEKIRHTSAYGFFYFAIIVSLLNLLPKTVISLFTIVSLPFRIKKGYHLQKTILLGGIIISLGIILDLGYGILLGRKEIHVENVKLRFTALPQKLNGLKIIQISDLHLGSFENDHFLSDIVDKINSLHPDLILFTGDMVNNFYQEMEGFEQQLGSINARYGKFAILGNHDYGDYTDWDSKEEKDYNQDMIDRKIEVAGFRLLRNSSVKISINDTALYIAGVENWGHKPFPQYANLNKAMKDVKPGYFCILMTHDPAHWTSKVLPQTKIPLTLSGHTHGGQFALKIAGISFSPIWLIEKDWGGLYSNGNRYLYVNRGIGCIGFRGRIDMMPEITVLTLSGK